MEQAQSVAVKKKGISGSTVKLIAIVTMLIDHIAAVILMRMLMRRNLLGIAGQSDIQAVMDWLQKNAVLYYGVMFMRQIGRLGFPLFAFLLVEGFQKTHDVKKYAMRLGIFALISEIPFNLALTGKVIAPGYQNVYFTLFLGLGALYTVKWLEEHSQTTVIRGLFIAGGILLPSAYWFLEHGSSFMPLQLAVSLGLVIFFTVMFLVWWKKRGLEEAGKICSYITAVLFFMLLADLLKTDYAGMGVLTMAAIYTFRKNKVYSMLAGCIVLAVMSLSELAGFFALIPVALYNGERGLKLKYVFYLFYPVHLLILWLIAAAMGMGGISAV